MTDYFEFLQEASEDRKLQIFREEANARVAERPIPEDSDEDAERSEDEEDKKDPRPPPAQRHFSKTLKDMIGKANRKYACDPKQSDISCFREYTSANARKFGNSFKDADLFAEQLQQVTKIMTHLIPSTSYLRNELVKITAMFKAIWVPHGEDEKTGKWLSIVAKYVRAPKAQVIAYLNAKERRLAEKLRDAYNVNFQDVDNATREMFAYGNAGSEKKFGAATLLALGTCCGARKGEFLDPHIEFYTYAEWQRKQKRDAAKMVLGTPDGDHLDISDNPNDELSSHLLVQVGVLKDADQKSNKYQDANDDGDLVPNRVVIKPTLFYDAQTIVDKIKEFRKKYNINKASFTDRVRASNNWGSALFKPVLKKFYRASYTKSKQKNWSIGSHFGRKLYAVASFGVYRESVQAASNEIVREASWISMVLAHQGSVATSLSYANVQVNFTIKPAALEMPPKEVLDEVYRDVSFLRKQIDKLVKQKGVVVNSNKQEAGFITEQGQTVTIARHVKRKYADDADRKATYEHFANELKKHGLPVNNENLEKLGLGREIQRKFLGKRKQRVREAPSDLDEQKHEELAADTPSTPPVADVPHRADDQQQQKRKRNKQHTEQHQKAKPGKYHTLEDNEKVIAPNPKGEKAREIAHQRDVEAYGADNVVINEQDCAGTVTEPVELSKKKWRKLCVDE